MKPIDPIELLAFNAAELYSTSTIAAIHCNAGRDLRAMLVACSPGDIVVEITALGCKGRPAHDAIGRLIVVRKEFVPFEDAQPEDEDQGYMETYTYIETFDGRLARWHNCNFVRVLEDREFKMKEFDELIDRER